MLTFKSHESLMRWILIIHRCSEYTLLFRYYHANELHSMAQDVQCHRNVDTHALTWWLLGFNSPGNTPSCVFFSCMWDMSAPMCARVMQFDLFLMYLGLHKSVNAPLCAACVHSSSNAITVVLIGLRHPMPRCIIRLNSRVICARGFGPISSLQPLLTLAGVL